MKLPENHTEEQVLAAIENVVNSLAYKYTFFHHTLEDVKQEARILALEALPRYDGVRSLEAFLWVHVNNRLMNFKRDNYERRDNKPCNKCPHALKFDRLCVRA